MQHKLIKRLEDRRVERERLERVDKKYSDHMRTIREAGGVVDMDFWCEACGKDFTANGFKHIGEAGRWPVAWYEGRCPERHVCRRRITDKGGDSYYRKSKMMAIQRKENADDMLLPSDPRFKLIYPQQWRELYGR